MKAACWGFGFALVMSAIASSGVAQAQQAAPQFYGYGGKQQPQPSGQAHYGCQPGPGCQPERVGCGVTVCPCPCSTANTSQYINSQIPPIQPVPGCQEPGIPVVTVIDELPPTTPTQTITLHRNCYVPIKVVTQPTPSNV